MRPSYYNVLAPAKDGAGTLLYNTLSGASAILDADERAQFEQIARDGSEPGDDFAEALAEAGFLLEDPRDEPEMLRYEFERLKFNKRVLELYVLPTLECNFTCVYCYEDKRPGRMSVEVQDALIEFVKDQYEDAAYKELKIVWYGGEPLLCMDIIERLSGAFIEFCEEKGIEYYASIITNGLLADAPMRKRMQDCRIWCVMATLDGEPGVHERTRHCKNGCASFDTIAGNIDGCIECGMSIDLRCVIERNNAESCLSVAERYAGNDLVGIRLNQMRDYNDFQHNNPDAAAVDILPAPEHARYVFREFMQHKPGKEEFEEFLRPLPLFCSTNVDREYNIDELGNAYACSAVVGDESQILFNIAEPPGERAINERLITRYGLQNPIDTEECATCRVFPLCRGGCARTRMEGHLICPPIKYIIEDVLTEFSAFV